MPQLFHQNMRIFRPGGPVGRGRVPAYVQAFTQVAASAPAIEVAGFTEVMTTRDPNNAFRSLTGALMGGAARRTHLAVNIGTTINGTSEYVVLAFRRRPVAVGRIMLAAAHHGLLPIADRPTNPARTTAWAAARPRAALLDYRGVAYCIYDLPNRRRIAVGFAHNIWQINDARSALVQMMPSVIGGICRDPALNGIANPEVYVLGDFNALPVMRRAGAAIAVPHARGIVSRRGGHGAGGIRPEWRLTPAQARAGRPGGTTLSGPLSLYDYTYSVNGRVGEAGIDVRTLDYRAGSQLPGLMSDHAAVVLRL